MKTYFNSKDFSDVLFIIEKQMIYAHKIILSSKSPYFKELIRENCKDNSFLEIEIEDAKYLIFYNLLEYIYTNSILLNIDNIWDIYKGSKFYQLNELNLECTKFILNLIDSKNVFDIWKNSQKYNIQLISEHCIMFIISNFKNESTKTLNINDNVDEIKIQLKIIENSNFISNLEYKFNPTIFPTNETIQSFPQFFNQDSILERRNSQLIKRLSIMDPNQRVIILQSILNSTSKLFECEKSNLFLYDKETDELYNINDFIRIKKDEGLIGNSFQSSKILKIEKDSKYFIYSPILKENQVIGVLEIENKLYSFTNDDDLHLKTISLLLSILLSDKNDSKLIEDDLNDFILEKRNSIDFKLPNEDLDTSYHSLIRSSSSIDENDENEKKKRKK